MHRFNTAEVSNSIESASSAFVKTRRDLMVFRARVDSLDQILSDMRENLRKIDGMYSDMKISLSDTSAKCRDTVSLCEALDQISAESAQ